ncbi:MAG: EpsG family protein, partial [Clostridia bacterium]|nr:EpsG family protein [Clostridia bacterium]
DGTNIFRVLFYSVPALMSLVFRSYIERANDPLINVCVNLAIVTTGFYIFSFYTSGILMGAIPIYFSLSNYILIPWLLGEVFNENSAKYLKTAFIVVYSVFFYYQCGPTWGLL